jgi:hypothetical protein
MYEVEGVENKLSGPNKKAGALEESHIGVLQILQESSVIWEVKAIVYDV